MIDIYYCNHKRCRGVHVPNDRRESGEQHAVKEPAAQGEKRVAWYEVEGQQAPYFCSFPACLGHTYKGEHCPNR